MATVALDAAVVAASASATSAASRQPPEVIAGYRRVRPIGSGGMAQVFEAVHQTLGRRIALKLLKPAVADNPDFNLRFLRESHAMATVSHANVVAIHDAGESDGFMYMALEYVSGGDLARLLKRRGTLDSEHALELMLGCAKGLAAIHAAGLVHRDIKPANIFLDQDGQPKIGDLGLARAADGEDRMTMTGTSWGTPSFMSPEQIKGVADIDIRSDIYALGATLFTLVTGHEPFMGETSYVITHRVLTEPVPDPRSINSLIPPTVSAVVMKAMAKDRTKRYQTPQEMAEDLERARSGQRLLHTAAITQPVSAVGNTAILIGAQVAVRRPSSGGGRALPTMDPRVLKLIAMLAVGGILGLAFWSMQGMKLAPRGNANAAPAWATLTGKDLYGTWATLSIGSTPIRLRHCAAGSFTMGSPAGEPGRQANESPHPVTLSRGFWMLDTECPQALYADVIGANPSTNQGPDLPVEGVSWQEAVDFCKALAKRDTPIPARLPTEAEWEYACRAANPDAFALKSDINTFAWVARGELLKTWRDSPPEDAEDSARRFCARAGQDPALRTQPVAKLTPNAFGLYDLHGNVLEWCADAWDGKSAYANTAVSDPEESAGGLSIARGGCWFYPPERCRSASRLGLKPTATLNYVGFRFVISDPPPSP